MTMETKCINILNQMFIHLQEGHTSHSLNESVFNTSGLFGRIFKKQKGI